MISTMTISSYITACKKFIDSIEKEMHTSTTNQYFDYLESMRDDIHDILIKLHKMAKGELTYIGLNHRQLKSLYTAHNLFNPTDEVVEPDRNA